MGLLRRLFNSPDPVFYDLFEAAAANVAAAGGLLDRMLARHPDAAGLAEEIRDLEHAGDRITHDLLHRLGVSSRPPFDAADVHELASALDDVVDLVEEVSDLFGLYKIEAPMDQALELAHVLALACAQITEAMPLLRTGGDFSAQVIEVNRLEDEGDRISREAVASLFDAGIDPMVVIRWKDVFERLEDAIDATERTANVLEGIRIKNA